MTKIYICGKDTHAAIYEDGAVEQVTEERMAEVRAEYHTIMGFANAVVADPTTTVPQEIADKVRIVVEAMTTESEMLQ